MVERTFSALVFLCACSALLLSACSDSESTPGPSADATDAGGDEGTPDVIGDLGPGEPDVEPDAPAPALTFTKPDWYPDKDTDGDEVVALEGLEGAVRVFYDDRGIPHIYAASERDGALAQGYLTAQARLFQMHTLRLAASGRLGEVSGWSAVQGDVYLRMLGLRRVGEESVQQMAVDEPEILQAFEWYSQGVNLYIDKVNAGEVPPPQEVGIFGVTLEPWTPTDIMAFARLQTWDLSFDAQWNADRMLAMAQSLEDRFGGTALEGVTADVLNLAPVWQTPTIGEGEGGAAMGEAYDIGPALAQPLYAGISAESWRRMAEESARMQHLPHRMFSGGQMDATGSNNWVVSGDHTASGRPIVSNDPHLSLRNPSVWYHVHLNTALAGGDLNSNGVVFPGTPGIVLGQNDYASWGATVFYSDVTDVYIETLSADGQGVVFNGEDVPFEVHEESFEYLKLGDDPCEKAAENHWIADLEPVFTESEDGKTCSLTVTYKSVPHHGPVIPWSLGMKNEAGDDIVMTWRWTGFEPSNDAGAIYRLNRVTSPEGFREALDHFGVGAQNWIYGDTAGNIGWYPSHKLPIRANIAAGDTTYPPFLPMPGDGSAEWDGYVPRDELPQSFNPAKGYLVTANADPTGTTFDNNPFNDGHYLGHYWTPGFRQGRSSELVAAAVAKGGITAADMQAIQADHKSPMGAIIAPHVVAALDRINQTTPLTDRVQQARDILEEWADHDYLASNGVGATEGSAEAKAAVAASIFNVLQVRLVHNALGDEGLNDLVLNGVRGMPDGGRARLLARMLDAADTMATWDDALGESLLWQDNSAGPVDTPTPARDLLILTSLNEALDVLADPAAVDNAGGFGTDDMSQWRWGALHTVKLRHNVLPIYDIPPASELPNGFPRHGDNFIVDASHPGMLDMDFRFGSGPSIRGVYEMLDVPERWCVLAGGQNEDARKDHYRDEMDLWVVNEAPLVPHALEDVVAAKQKVVDFIAPALVGASDE